MDYYLIILGVLLGAGIYVYRKRMINHARLIPLSAEIFKIKMGYMSSAKPEGLDIRRRFFGGHELPGQSTSIGQNSAISIPEVLVQYRYFYNGMPYTGEKYVLITEFLNDIPFQLDFNEFGPDFPVLVLPGRRIVGEENIEDYLLTIQSDIPILVDQVNPQLSILPEEEARMGG